MFLGKRVGSGVAELPHGEFEAMAEVDLPFGASTARRLMTVARDNRLTNRTHVHVLPPFWRPLRGVLGLPCLAVFDGAMAVKVSGAMKANPLWGCPWPVWTIGPPETAGSRRHDDIPDIKILARAGAGVNIDGRGEIRRGGEDRAGFGQTLL